MGETICIYVVQRRQMQNIDEQNNNDDECYCKKID
jgi:hypothetical protein